jgi:hypothetical protein
MLVQDQELLYKRSLRSWTCRPATTRSSRLAAYLAGQWRVISVPRPSPCSARSPRSLAARSSRSALARRSALADHRVLQRLLKQSKRTHLPPVWSKDESCLCVASQPCNMLASDDARVRLAASLRACSRCLLPAAHPNLGYFWRWGGKRC